MFTSEQLYSLYQRSNFKKGDLGLKAWCYLTEPEKQRWDNFAALLNSVVKTEKPGVNGALEHLVRGSFGWL